LFQKIKKKIHIVVVGTDQIFVEMSRRFCY